MRVWRAWLAAIALALALPTLAHGVRAEASPPTLAWQQPLGVELEREIDCLALNIYFEARSESRLGKLAVAAVTLNRVAAPAFPDNVCAVVNQGEERGRHLCQFSWRCDGLTDTPANVAAWLDARSVAQQALTEPLEDPTGGALWYHADHVLPDWAYELRRQAQIGHHLFYGPGPRPPRPVAKLMLADVGLERPPRCASLAGCTGAAAMFRPRLLDAQPLPRPRSRLGPARSWAGMAGRIRLTPFERNPATTRDYLALAQYLGAPAHVALAAIKVPPVLGSPELVR
jgi:N-acetylmuramoyl-L-alanine amidase